MLEAPPIGEMPEQEPTNTGAEDEVAELRRKLAAVTKSYDDIRPHADRAYSAQQKKEGENQELRARLAVIERENELNTQANINKDDDELSEDDLRVIEDFPEVMRTSERIADRLVTGAGGDVEPIEHIFNLDDKVLKKSRIPIYILPDDAVPEDSPYFLGFAPRFDSNCIIKSNRFEKSLRKLRKGFPVIEKMLDKALNTFTHGSSTGGLRFKKMEGPNDKYEFRLNQGLRVIARYSASTSNEDCTSEFLLEDIGKHKVL